MVSVEMLKGLQLFEGLDDGELEKDEEPHDWSKAVRPRSLELEPINLMDRLKETKKVIEGLGL